ncbi:AsmA family protein [Labilibaculum sp. DW002]|uniref:AsmA family protein n=1 Tax=Paralabilibaculum antarcticum TaxID=2912572 RepID=A0ABT5VVY7_9BACT|nr:AsmA-like C-terminal region-containing protein [Labilibaculum sp. DW002]MDE5419586.1 AsmA family protein [Labilibaculum sp. DW002]
MKKFLKIFGGFVVVVLALLIILPFFFKDQILEKVKTEINNTVDAKVEIGDLSLSMFKNFPNLYVELENVSVVGNNEFENDTLAFVGSLYTAVDLGSAISGTKIEVGAIVLANAKVNALVLESGKANWDIAKESEEELVEEETGEASDFKVVFEEVRIEDFSLRYDDASLKTLMTIDDLDLALNGDFSVKSTNLNVNSQITGIDLDYEGVKYLKKAEVTLDAVLAADLQNMLFTFKENKLTLNELVFGVDGNVGMLDDGYSMDLKMNAQKADFKTLLSMVPDVFKADFEGLETTGSLALTAFAKGEYKEEQLPSFGAKLNVEKATIKYPDLPESVQNINIDAEVNHPGGDMDLLTADVNAFHFEVANNPFDAEMHVKNPISDPNINGLFKGVIDFSKIRHAIPMDSVKITGIVTSDVSFSGRMSSIEKEEYEKFMAKGDVKLKNFEFATPDFPQGIKIINSVLNFTPKYISLASFDSRIGKSDIKLKGRIENYIPYALKDQVLKGNFNLTSNSFNVNEFMTEEEETEATGDTIPLSVVEIPANLDLQLVSSMKLIQFDKMNIENVKGLIVVKNAKAQLTNLSMDMLKGQMTMNGSYSTKDVKKPNFDFGLDVKEFDIKSTYESLSMVKKMIPMALNCEGKVSSDLKIASLLDQEMNPVMKTLNGNGAIHSKEIIIKDNKAFDALAAALKNDDYKRISVTQFDMNFVITNGNVEVKPFDAKVAGHPARIYGTQSVDGKLNFTMDMKLPKEELGKEVNQYFDKLPGFDAVQALDVAVKITGTVDNPNVKLDLSKAIKQAQKAVAKELERKAKKEIEKKGKDLLRKLFK